MRKLKSREYCHNCGKVSDWEFEDRPGNQIIICPECGHKHYRVVTGELVRPEIRWNGQVITDVKKFLEEHPELKEKFQELEKEAEERFKISDERWGRDPSQVQAGGGTLCWSWTSTDWTGSTGNTVYSSITGYWYSFYDSSS